MTDPNINLPPTPESPDEKDKRFLAQSEKVQEQLENAAEGAENTMADDFKRNHQGKLDQYLIEGSFSFEFDKGIPMEIDFDQIDRVLSSSGMDEESKKSVEKAFLSIKERKDKLNKRLQEKYDELESERKLEQLADDYNLKEEKKTKDPNINGEDEMKQALDIEKEELSESKDKTDKAEGKIDFELLKNAKFPIEFRDSGNKKYIAIVKYIKEEDKFEIVEGDVDGKKGRSRKNSISTLVKKLKFFKLKDGGEEPYISGSFGGGEKELAEKTPGTPEVMQAKLDELKNILISKENELKLYKEGHPNDAEQSVIEKFEKEIAEINEEIDETGKYFDASRTASEKILGKIRNQVKDVTGNPVRGYEDFNAEAREEGDEKFKKKAQQLWMDFVTHGIVSWDDNKKEYVFNGTNGDLDSESCEALLEKAGLNMRYLKRVPQGEFIKGKTMLDTGGEEGVVYRKEDGTLFIDHHGEDSPRNVSATARTYDLLVKMGFLQEDEAMEKLVKYVNETDNAIDVDVDSYFLNSWKTMRGLHRFVKFNELYNFFKKDGNPDPGRELNERELERYGLKKRSKEQEERATELHGKLEQLEKEGFIIDSEKYGKVVIDIGGKVRKDFEAIRAYGANTYLVWNPERGEFWMTSENKITDKFPQGKNVRDTMWITEKREGKPEMMKMTLEEVLRIIAGNEGLDKILEEKDEGDPTRLKHEKLIEFFKNEDQEKTEREKKEKEKWDFSVRLKMAEEDYQDAKENVWVSRAANRIRAWGVSPYEDLFPGDDYSLMKKVMRQDYEEAKGELERLRSIANDPDKARLFEEEEKKKMEKKVRASESESLAIKAREELGEARKEYVEMIKKKKGMWDGVNKFFSGTKDFFRKDQEAVTQAVEGVLMDPKERRLKSLGKVNLDQEGVKYNENGEKEYYNNRPEVPPAPVDHDVEFYKKIYEEKLIEYKKAMYEHIRVTLADGEDLTKELAAARRHINMNEAAKFYTGSLDAHLEKNAENSDSWKLVWTKKESWISKLPDKFAVMAEKISDAYFGTKNVKAIEKEVKKGTEKRKKEEEKKKKKEEEEKTRKENEEIKNLAKGKIEEVKEAKKSEEGRIKRENKGIKNLAKEKVKLEKEEAKKKEIRIKNLNRISNETTPREIVGDIRKTISSNDGSIWESIRKGMVLDEMDKDESIKKTMKKFIKNSKKRLERMGRRGSRRRWKNILEG